MNRRSIAGHLAMGSANCLWGMMSPMAKAVMATGLVSPFVLIDMRIAGAMVLFWAVSFLMPREHVPHQDLFRLFFCALFGIVLNQGSFTVGVALTSPADASILATSMPLWAMILAAVILKDPITARKIVGIALGAGGAVILIASSQQNTAAHNEGDFPLVGDLLVTFAQLCFALYIVRFKDLIARYSLVTIMKWMFTYSFVMVMPFTTMQLVRTPWIEIPLEHVGYIAFVVVMGTFCPYLLMVMGQNRLPPTVAAMYNYVQPVVACALAIAWGMDSFTVLKAEAVAMIFLGVYQVTHARSRPEIEEHHAAQQALKEAEAAGSSSQEPAKSDPQDKKAGA